MPLRYRDENARALILKVDIDCLSILMVKSLEDFGALEADWLVPCAV